MPTKKKTVKAVKAAKKEEKGRKVIKVEDYGKEGEKKITFSDGNVEIVDDYKG